MAGIHTIVQTISIVAKNRRHQDDASCLWKPTGGCNLTIVWCYRFNLSSG